MQAQFTRAGNQVTVDLKLTTEEEHLVVGLEKEYVVKPKAEAEKQ